MHNTGVYFDRIKSLQDLMNYSFKIGLEPILVSKSVKLHKISNQDFFEIPDYVYTRKGIYVGFKMNGNLHLLPCSSKIDLFLERNGFSKMEFEIPFTEDTEYPVEESSRWIELYHSYLNGYL